MISIRKTATFFEGVQELKKMLDKRVFDFDITHIVVVPDRYTFEIEQKLFSDNYGAFDVEVMTLRRLAALYTTHEKTLSKQGAVAAISKIISECGEELCCFESAAGKKGFAASIFETVAQLKSCRISPSDIKAGEGALGRKMRDLKYIYQKYEDFVAASGCVDMSDIFRDLADYFFKTKHKKTHFYFANFYDMTAQGVEILKAIATSAASLTVFLCDSALNPFFYNKELVSKLEKSLCEFAPDTQALPTVFEPLVRNFYRPKTEPQMPRGEIGFFAAENIIGELLYTARDIRFRAARHGVRYKEIGIIVEGDIHDCIDRIFQSFEIPFFFERKKSLLEHPLSQFVMCLWAAVDKGARRREVLRLLKNPIFDIAKDKKDIFENCVLKASTNFGGFFSPIAMNTDKYRNTDEDKEAAKICEEVRAALARSLQLFKDKMEGKNTAYEFSQAIFAVLESLNAKETVEGLTAVDPYSVQAYPKLEAVLSQLVEIFESKHLRKSEFFDSLEEALASCEIALIPEKSDCVQIGKPEMFLSAGTKYLYVLGMNEGVLPSAKEDLGLVSDRDIEALKAAAGIDISPKISFLNNASRNILFQAIAPSENVLFSYSLSDHSGSQLKPSIFLLQLERIFPNATKKTQVVEDLLRLAAPQELQDTELDTLAKYVGSSAAAKSYLVGAARMYQEGALNSFPHLARILNKKYGAAEQKFLSPHQNIAERLKCGKELFAKGKTKISQLETYFYCPFSHFLKYGLNASERESASVDGAEIGTFLHKVIEYFIKARKDSDGDIRALAERAFQKAVKAETAFVERADAETLRRLEDESIFVCGVIDSQLASGSFKPFGAEVSFGEGKALPPLVLDLADTKINLAGTIDRVDISHDEKMARVIDYKTGKNVGYHADGLYNGTKIQLFVYLQVLRRLGYAPAGAFLFRVHSGSLSSTDYRLKGVYVYTDEVVSAMDSTLLPGESSGIIHARRKKDGELYKSASLPEDFSAMAALCDYAEAVSIQAAREILDGNIDISPCGNACLFCSFKDICGFDEEEGGQIRKTPACKNTDIIEIMKATETKIETRH